MTPIEKTQRTRSFLFASLAFVLARMFGKERFTFFENGVISFNLPIAGDVLGARATRTTHPRVIRGFWPRRYVEKSHHRHRRLLRPRRQRPPRGDPPVSE